MFSTVIFDLDGTLLDTLGDLAAAGNHTLAALGLPRHPAEAYRQFVGDGISKLVRRMLPPAHRGEASFGLALSMFLRRYEAHKQDLTKPYPGIDALLQSLCARGLRLGVASNKPDAPARELVEAYFPGVFLAVAGQRENWNPKPDPACVFWLLEELGARPAETLYVGDSGVDMRTAAAAGLAACGVLWGFRGREELAAAGAGQLAETPAELQALILS